MKGSEKQVAYAKDIIAKRVSMVEAINSGKISKCWWATNHASGATPEFNFDNVCEFLNSMTDAVEVIESIDEKVADLYAKHIGFKYPELTTDYDESDPFAL